MYRRQTKGECYRRRGQCPGKAMGEVQEDGAGPWGVSLWAEPLDMPTCLPVCAVTQPRISGILIQPNSRNWAFPLILLLNKCLLSADTRSPGPGSVQGTVETHTPTCCCSAV